MRKKVLMYIGLLSVLLAGLPRQAAISEVTWKVKEGNGNYSLLAYHLEGTIKEQHVYPSIAYLLTHFGTKVMYCMWTFPWARKRVKECAVKGYVWLLACCWKPQVWKGSASLASSRPVLAMSLAKLPEAQMERYEGASFALNILLQTFSPVLTVLCCAGVDQTGVVSSYWIMNLVVPNVNKGCLKRRVRSAVHQLEWKLVCENKVIRELISFSF